MGILSEKKTGDEEKKDQTGDHRCLHRSDDQGHEKAEKPPAHIEQSCPVFPLENSQTTDGHDHDAHSQNSVLEGKRKGRLTHVFNDLRLLKVGRRGKHGEDAHYDQHPPDYREGEWSFSHGFVSFIMSNLKRSGSLTGT